MSSITPRQADCLNAIKSLTRHGVAPSYREIGKAIGLSSLGGVAELINGLHRRGFIRRTPRQARALEVIGDPASDTLDFMPTSTREQVQDYAQRHSMTAEKAVAEICQRYLAGRVSA